MAQDQRLLDALREISSLLLSEQTLKSTLERVAFLSVKALDACDAGGVSVIDGSQVVTAASSDESVLVVDEIQYRYDQGPCVQAIRDGEINRIDSLTEETRWPKFVEFAGKLGVSACLAIPLMEETSTFGSLNLYSYGDRRFSEEDEAWAVALGAQAAGPLSNARRYTELQLIATYLEQTISSPVDVAVGVLMERDGITRAEAIVRLDALAEKDGGDLQAAARAVVVSVMPVSDGSH